MIYKFGDFRLDTQLLELRCDDTPVPIEPQVFDLLRLLIENRDEIVSKDQVIDVVWNGRIISEATLSSRLNSVRRAVGDDGKRQDIIRTLPRRGFRFVHRVEVEDEVQLPDNAAGHEREKGEQVDIAFPESRQQSNFSDKPSIAVLPFDNMSGDPDQEYFSDGITEDIITALSRIRQFFVIARNTTFTYKGQAVDVPAVAKELGVRYVLEGSVRKAENKVRISAQLIDGESGRHIWAERYDREMEDIFALQDELALTLCGTIEPELAKSEQQRIISKAPENMEAWDYYQRGMWWLQKTQKDEIAEARRMFERAMELDPNYSRAFVGYVATYSHGKRLGFLKGDRDTMLRAARRAVELDSNDAWSHWALGMFYYVDPDPNSAISEFEYAIELNPSFAEAHAWLGDSLSCAGRAEDAVSSVEQAIRLSPRDPFIGIMHARMGRAYLFLRQHEKAVAWSKSGLRHQNVSWPAAANLASALGHLGRLEEAKRAISEMQRLKPGITMDFVMEHTPVTHADYMDHLIDGLRKACMPE